LRGANSADLLLNQARLFACLLQLKQQRHLREIGNLLPNNRRQRRTCYALCYILYPVSTAHTSIFRMDSNSTSYERHLNLLGLLSCLPHRLLPRSLSDDSMRALFHPPRASQSGLPQSRFQQSISKAPLVPTQRLQSFARSGAEYLGSLGPVRGLQRLCRCARAPLLQRGRVGSRELQVRAGMHRAAQLSGRLLVPARGRERAGGREREAAKTASFYLLPGHEPFVSASDSPRCERLLARALGLRAKHSETMSGQPHCSEVSLAAAGEMWGGLDALRRGCTTHDESLLGEDGLESTSRSSSTEEGSSSGRSERAPESSASFPICVPPTSSRCEHWDYRRCAQGGMQLG